MSLIGLGMTWQTKEKWLYLKSSFLIFIFTVTTILYFWFPGTFQFLDIRYSLGWLDDHDTSEILLGKMKFLIINFVWTLIVCSMVCSQHLLIFWQRK